MTINNYLIINNKVHLLSPTANNTLSTNQHITICDSYVILMKFLCHSYEITNRVPKKNRKRVLRFR